MSGRGSTRRGAPAALPAGSYSVPPGVVLGGEDGAVLVLFRGEDGREQRFDFSRCPLPGWHRPIAAAMSQRVGPAGGLRTQLSARKCWRILRYFLHFLALHPQTPATPQQLRAEHLRDFITDRTQVRAGYGPPEADHVVQVLRYPPIRDLIDPAVLDAAPTRIPAARPRGRRGGYSDGELHRVLAAARAHLITVRRRIEDSERLLAADPTELDPQQLLWRADLLEVVTARGTCRARRREDARHRARQLFLLRQDVPSALVLLVAVTGLNIETVKELPAEHEVIEQRAVRLRVIKRRRGEGAWWRTVTWEIGPPGRELHHPGGLWDRRRRGRRSGRAPAAPEGARGRGDRPLRTRRCVGAGGDHSGGSLVGVPRS